MNNFIFFLSATLIVVLSIAALCTGPIINTNVGDGWGTLNCKKLSDEYEDKEKLWEKEENEAQKKTYKEELDYKQQEINSCNRRKAFYGLEYSALIIDLCAGFICSILGLLLYLNEGKSFSTKTGLIGLVFGAVGFVMTLVYLIYSILVYTKDKSEEIKTEEDGSYASWDQSKGVYICNFYKENHILSMYSTYSELGKKQYNYNKDDYQKYQYDTSSEIKHCTTDPGSNCLTNNEYPGPKVTYITGTDTKECSKLYIERTNLISNKSLSDRWLTTIILSAIIILCSICLALFGFLLFKNKEGSSGGEVKVV